MADVPPSILFRVFRSGYEAKHGVVSPTPRFRHGGYLLSRELLNPRNSNCCHVGPEAQDVHLSWQLSPTPYISLCDWPKAFRMINGLRLRGADQITLVAFDTRRISEPILDAYASAVALGYRDDGLDPRRQLRNHIGEWLLTWGYNPEDDAVLWILKGLEDLFVLHSTPTLKEIEEAVRDKDSFWVGKILAHHQPTLENEPNAICVHLYGRMTPPFSLG